MKKVFIELSTSGVTYDCENCVEDVVEAIKEEWERSGESMERSMELIEIHGLSISKVVRVYEILRDEFNNCEQEVPLMRAQRKVECEGILEVVDNYGHAYEMYCPICETYFERDDKEDTWCGAELTEQKIKN